MKKLPSSLAVGFSVLAVLSSCSLKKQQATPGKWSFVQSNTVPDEFEERAGLNIAGFSDDRRGIAILAHDGVMRYTSDGGKQWIKVDSIPGDLVALEILDPHHAFASGGPYLRSSLVGWIAWKELPGHGGGGSQAGRFLSFVDPLLGWFATSASLEITRDGGESWSPLHLPANTKGAITAVHMRSATEGYVLYSDGMLYSTSDGAKKWQAIRTPLAGREPLTLMGFAAMEAVRFPDASHGVLVQYKEKPGHGFHAYRTVDGGDRWVEDQLPADHMPKVGSIFLSRDAQWLTTNDIDSCALSIFKLDMPPAG